LKIAEGCSRHCTYCIISKLRGRQKSRPQAAIVEEARALIANGAKEVTLVAQETTAYGQDLAPPGSLSQLLNHLAGLDPAVWIRCLYGHPESFGPDVIEAIATHTNLCSYVDIPIQHAAAPILKRMGRRYTYQDLLRLFDALRDRVPDIALRTTVLVGFPGETETEFDQLKHFLVQVRFDHLGVFAYSDADDLASHRLSGHVDAGLAQDRLDELMALQRDVSAQKLTRYLGRQLDVLIEERQEDGFWMGRTMYQAPEVDGVTFVRTPANHVFEIGTFVKATILESMDYDLVAEVI